MRRKADAPLLRHAVSVLAAALCLGLSACSSVSSVRRTVDDFSGKKMASVDVYCTVSDSGEDGTDISGATHRFVRETGADGSSAASIYLDFRTPPGSFGIDNSCIVKTDGGTCSLNMDPLGSADTTETSTSSIPVYGHDKSGRVIYLGTSMSSTTKTTRESKFKIVLPSELQQAMLNSSTLAFRFYEAQMPFTIVYNDEQIKAVKAVLSSD